MVIQRDLYKRIKPYLRSKEAIIITGMRRVGKTTLIRFIFDEIRSHNKVFIDLENPLNRKIFEEVDYEKIKKGFELSGLDFQKNTFIFLDEIQFVSNMPSIVKYFIDHYQVKFFLTGSASFYLKNLFSESLAGRKYLLELFPLNFSEFLKLKDENITQLKKPTKFLWQKLYDLYEEYMEFGGFPEIILQKSRPNKIQALKDIFSSYFQMEVKQLGDFKKDEKIRDLILLLAERIGGKLDVQKLAQELGLARETVSQYLSFLEGTYFIKTIRPFSYNKDVEIRTTPKIYFCDVGLANNIAKLNKGSLFEQAVFQNLYLKGEVNYYQRKNGAEIDFILEKTRAYEVKISPSLSDVNKLKKISQGLRIKNFKIVAFNYTELPNTIYGFGI